MDISKEELYKEYIINNKSTAEIASIFNCGKTTIKNKLRAYGIVKSKEQIQQAQKQTNLKKYGCEYVLQSKDVINKRYETNLQKYGAEIPSKNKDVIEKMKQTNLQKYGCESVLQNKFVMEKKNNTMLDRYGVVSALQNEELKKKAIDTTQRKYGTDSYFKTDEFKINREILSLQKYGTPSPMQSDVIKNRIKRENIERYGVDTYLKTDEFKEKSKATKLKNRTLPFYKKELYDVFISYDAFKNWVSENFNETPTARDISNKIGYNEGNVLKRVHELNAEKLINMNSHISSYEKEITNMLKNWGVSNIELSNRTILDGKEIDIYLPAYKIGIEFNGNFWHSDFKLENTYHQEKSLLAESKGVFLYHIFEYEWYNNKEKIKNHLKDILNINIKTLYARKCVLKEISNKEKTEFLKENHLQGNDKSSIFIGLYYNNELMTVMTFGKARYSQKASYELFRYCTKAGYRVIGGASKMFKYFVDKYLNIIDTTVVSYCNISKSQGKIYSTLGFASGKISDPNYIWWNPSTKEVKTKYTTKVKNEASTMHKNGFFKICDAGNRVWTFTKNEFN